jgi:hypothetical protein
MKIVRFLQGASFEPEDIEVMDQAFATAALILGLPSDDDERAQEVARTVIEFAMAGERDLVTLTAAWCNVASSPCRTQGHGRKAIVK